MTVWLIGIGAVLLGLAAGVIGLHIVDRIRLGRKIAELKAQGIPTRYAEVEACYKLPEGTANAADIYIKAFEAYRPLPDTEKNKLLPVFGCQPEPEDGKPYPPEQMAVAAEFMQRNQELFKLLHEAGQVESCCYPIDTFRKSIPKLDILQNLRYACHALSLAMIHYRQTNQPQKEYEALLDQLQLGQSLSNSPSLISHQIRLSTLSIGISRTRDMINCSILSENQMRQMQDLLRQISQSIIFRKPLLGEICFYVEHSGFWQVNSMVAISFYRHPIKSCITWILPKNTAGLLECYRQILDIDTFPIEQQLSKVRDIIKQIEGSWYRNMAAQTALSNIEQIFEMIHLGGGRVRIDCAVTALAIERYRLKEGKLPQTIEALVPGYLPQVYMNPFDGKPLRYEQTNPGYKIYTVCEEGVDKEEKKSDIFNWRKMRSKMQTYVFEVKR